MRTGNAILGCFFYGMGIYLPLRIIDILAQNETLVGHLPFGLDAVTFAMSFFVAFLTLGTASLAYGIERPAKEPTAEPKPKEKPRWKEMEMKTGWKLPKLRKEPKDPHAIQFSKPQPAVKRTPVLDRREFDERFP